MSAYTFDAAKLQQLREDKPWMNDPLHFKKVMISPTSITKMLSHIQSGVQKGLRQGTKPIEVMGFMSGRPDPETPGQIIITDVFPLPIEGFETRVIADDMEVTNYMIALGESLENSRVEKFCGWYHSHPFDLIDRDHCFFSSVDLSTQLAWQRLEDPHGNPFVGIVLDPLRSLAKNEPILKAFRAYPPEYEREDGICPDGTKIMKESERLDKWGSCWRRYYQLETSFYISDLAESVIRRITENSFWKENFTNTLGGSKEAKKEDTKFLKDVGKKVGSINLDKGKAVASTGNPERGTMVVGPGEGGGGGGVGESEVKGKSPNGKALAEISSDTLGRSSKRDMQAVTDIVKEMLFGSLRCSCNNNEGCSMVAE